MDRDFRTVDDVNDYVYEPDERWAWQQREAEREAMINESLNPRYRSARVPGVVRERRPMNATERAAWDRLVAALGGTCAYCQRRGPLSVDHLIPVASGGRDEMANYAPACKSCNCSKGASDVMSWLERRASKMRLAPDQRAAWVGSVLARIRAAQEAIGVVRARS